MCSSDLDNTLADAPALLALSLAAGDVVSRFDHFGASLGPPVSMAADCTALTLDHATFERACDADGVLFPGAPVNQVTLTAPTYCPP